MNDEWMAPVEVVDRERAVLRIEQRSLAQLRERVSAHEAEYGEYGELRAHRREIVKFERSTAESERTVQRALSGWGKRWTGRRWVWAKRAK